MTGLKLTEMNFFFQGAREAREKFPDMVKLLEGPLRTVQGAVDEIVEEFFPGIFQ